MPLVSLSVLIRRWVSLPDPPTAVFADNDLSIGPLLNGLKSAGIRCPQDWSLVGFDDLPDNSGGGGFSSIHVSHHDMGQAAASQLVEIIQGRSAGAPADTDPGEPHDPQHLGHQSAVGCRAGWLTHADTKDHSPTGFDEEPGNGRVSACGDAVAGNAGLPL